MGALLLLTRQYTGSRAVQWPNGLFLELFSKRRPPGIALQIVSGSKRGAKAVGIGAALDRRNAPVQGIALPHTRFDKERALKCPPP